MVKQYKIDEVNNLVSNLKDRGNIILTNYSGTKVKDLSILRRQLREKNAEYKVVKNNLFKRALADARYEGLDEHLKGPIGVAFVGEEVGEVAKILKEFGEAQESFSYSAAVFENVVYGAEQVKTIADLPSKDVLLAQTMSLVNGPATGIAMGMNQIMASLARAINAVAEQNQNN
jgi:large subunit ribosomal protein L10